MEMFDPPHPGEIIREDCLKPLNLSVTEAAKGLGVSRQSLSELLNGRNGVSADMAIRLEKAGWSTAEILAAQSTVLRSLARRTACRPSQGAEVSRCGTGLKFRTPVAPNRGSLLAFVQGCMT